MYICIYIWTCTSLANIINIKFIILIKYTIYRFNSHELFDEKKKILG